VSFAHLPLAAIRPRDIPVLHGVVLRDEAQVLAARYNFVPISDDLGGSLSTGTA
jgi:hypothetical protein